MDICYVDVDDIQSIDIDSDISQLLPHPDPLFFLMKNIVMVFLLYMMNIIFVLKVLMENLLIFILELIMLLILFVLLGLVYVL